MSTRLVGTREIAKLLSLSRQRADQLVRTKGFPEPTVELASGRAWARSSVVRWAKANGRSVPWATVELELEQLPSGPPGSAINTYRAIWQMTRTKGLGRNPESVPTTREYAHSRALTAARETDPTFDIHMPDEVDDETGARLGPVRRSTFDLAELWFTRSGDDQRGYWHLEHDRDGWWIRRCFVADGSGWNLLERRPLDHVSLRSSAAPLKKALVDADVPTDIANDLLNAACKHAAEPDG